MEKVKRSDGQQMVELEAPVRGRRRQIQNNRIHTLVISLMILATGFLWYITPQPMSKGHHAAEDTDRKLSPNKPFSWSEVSSAVECPFMFLQLMPENLVNLGCSIFQSDIS
jgi:hypothetical protein